MDYTNDLCMDMFTQGQTDRIGTFVNNFRSNLDSVNAVNAGLYGCIVSATISGDDSVCIGDSIDLAINVFGTPPYDVVYTDGTSNFSLTNISNNHIERVEANVGSTTYSLVSVTDQDSTLNAPNSGITGSATIVASGVKPVSAQLSGSASICRGDSAFINFSVVGGIGPFNVTINNGIGTLSNIPNNTDIQVSPFDSSIYELLNVTDAIDCSTENFISAANVDVKATPFVFFLKGIDQNTVTFNNQSTGASTWDWDFGDGNTSNIKNPIHVYSTIGTKTITLIATNSGGCTAEYSENVLIASINSIDELRVGEKVNIFPNPTKATLHLDLELNNNVSMEIQILNTTGENLLNKRIDAISSNHSVDLELNSLPAGMYILKIALSDGRVVNTKVYKN